LPATIYNFNIAVAKCQWKRSCIKLPHSLY
jgi:hypothetical protein